MANIFPKWTVTLPIKLIVLAVVLGSAVFVGVAYYFTNRYTNVGYQPTQPVAFDHSIHATQVGIDCRYCHQSVEVSAKSSVPSVQTCMTCHSQVRKDSPKLQVIRDAWNGGKGDGPAVRWVRIHKVPDYVYYNHAIHVNSGISCANCHGSVNHMEEVRHDQPLTMGWCLECHRHPEYKIRPQDKVYDLDWKPASAAEQKLAGSQLVKERNINPPQTCAGCHR